jgi:hypothetical protein
MGANVTASEKFGKRKLMWFNDLGGNGEFSEAVISAAEPCARHLGGCFVRQHMFYNRAENLFRESRPSPRRGFGIPILVVATGPAVREAMPKTMTEDHPDPVLLERFMRNEAGVEERRGIVRHLLAGCGQCLAVTRRLWSLSDGRPESPPDAAERADGYSQVFRRLAARGTRHQARAFHRLALLLAKADRGEDALRTIRKARALYEHHGDEPNLVRLRHLEGKVREALGETPAAEAAFLEARQGFIRYGLGDEAAAVLLDLALLYQRGGRSREIRRLAEDLLPILRAGEIRPGAAAALLFFRDLVETGHATAEALLAVSGSLSGPRRRAAA